MNLCEYGCGQESHYQFKNGKQCCSSHYLKCPNQKKKLEGENNPFYNKKHTDKTKKKSSEKNKGKTAWNRNKPRTEEEKLNISIATKKAMRRPEIVKKMKNKPKGKDSPNFNGGYYRKNIPRYETFCKQISYAEKCRRNKNDKNILEVKCVYCGSWFIPTVTSVEERIRCLNGTGGGRLYCSDKCKQECSIFHQILYPKDHKPATSREVQAELRQMRFEVDNYTCQKCGKHQDELTVGLHCHHIEGIRWEALESADLDKVITLCKDCHIKVHKQEGCTYYDMQCKDY